LQGIAVVGFVVENRCDLLYNLLVGFTLALVNKKGILRPLVLDPSLHIAAGKSRFSLELASTATYTNEY